MSTRFLAAVALVTALPAAAEYQSPRLIREGFQAIDNHRYVDARGIAEGFLKHDPNSFEAWYILGMVYVYADPNLPRARYCLLRARSLMEQRYQVPLPEDGPWRIHDGILEELVEVAGLMDDRKTELQLIEEHDRLYVPKLSIRSGWALMKLGRYNEARRRTEALLGNKDPNIETEALNTLGVIADEQGDREGAFQWFNRLTSEVAQKGWRKSSVYLDNRAGQELGLLRFEDAERTLLEAASLGIGGISNPWLDLAPLYAATGRLPEAITGLRRMYDWSRAATASYREQNWSREGHVTSIILVAAGFTGEALPIVRQRLGRPDRFGVYSAHPDEGEIELLQTYAEALKGERERLSEDIACSNLVDSARLLWQRIRLDSELWWARRRAAALITDHRRLEWTATPYGTDSESPEWMRSSFREIVGLGPWETEVKHGLAKNTKAARLMTPYYIAELGEAEWAGGDYRGAVRDLSKAQSTLPKAEVLLRARVDLLLGNAAEKLGQRAQALSSYERVLQSDPRLFRLLDVSLPVTIQAAGDPAAQKAASLLR
ncbi:MAG: tetratricopeptide repeat protein, partial [Acidobacteriaceae bacterium]|nr:tetratricopeptide repeat protein [Acidobacteriaceae bacterium]